MIEANPGGEHQIHENLAEDQSKDDGMAQAWAEGHATYFSVSWQKAAGLGSLGIAGVGDRAYTGSNPGGIALHVSLEDIAVGGQGSGEDNELSVMRILWDLFDENADDGDEVTLGDRGVNRIIVNNMATTLSEFWAALTASATPREIDTYARIFVEHSVAPKPFRASVPADGSPPRFEWERRGGGPSFKQDTFTVEFYTQDLSELIFTSPVLLNVGDYVPGLSDWNSITSRGPLFNWAVKGSNTSPTETGPYRSFAEPIGSVDIAIVIDDTGSMFEEIGSVKTALETFILELAANPSGSPVINLITFKDDVTSRVISSDPAEVLTEVQALTASGGGLCPEASVEALTLAARNLRSQGRILFATDADAHDGANVRGAIEMLRSKGIRVDVLLTDSCSGSFKSAGACNTQDCLDDFGISKTPADCLEPECFDPIPPDDEPFPVEAVTVYSTIATATGGLFATIPEVNDGDPTSYTNVATNVLLGIIRPSITDSNPRVVFEGTTMEVVLTGATTNFNATSQVSIGGTGVTVNSTETLSPTALRVNLSVAVGADLTFRDLAVTTTFGKGISVEEATGIGVIEVQPSPVNPVIVTVIPSMGIRGETLDVVFTGVNTHFDDTSRAVIGPSLAENVVNSFTTLSPTLGVANVTIAENTRLGAQFVSVFTESISESAQQAFTGLFIATSDELLSGIPRITSVAPSASPPGTSVTLTLVGESTTFQDGVTVVTITGDGVTVDGGIVVSETELQVDITIDASAPFGFRDVFVTTGEEGASALNGFQVGTPIPVADAGEDRLVVSGGGAVPVTLDGSASSVTGGTIVAYNWSGTPDPDNVVMPTVALAPGEHTFTLVVEDDGGTMSAPDEVVITVNGAPVADAGADVEVVAVDGMATVALNGSASADPTKSIVSFVWTGSPDPDDVANPTVDLPLGDFVFTLVVVDNLGAMSAPDTVNVSVITKPRMGCGMGVQEGGRAALIGDAALLLATLLFLTLRRRSHL